MENREGDKMSRNTQPTSVGEVNRNTSSQIGKEKIKKINSSADFGQNIGRSEKLNEPSSRGKHMQPVWLRQLEQRLLWPFAGSEPRNNSDSDSGSGSRH